MYRLKKFAQEEILVRCWGATEINNLFLFYEIIYFSHRDI